MSRRERAAGGILRLDNGFACRREGPLRQDVPTSAPLPVVCAIIEDAQGRVLAAQRPAHKHLGGKWEFAGGKVEPGEAPEAALIREIREELGCDIELRRALPRSVHDYGTVTIEIIPFVCALADGSAPPHPHEHAAIRWVTRDELPTLDLAPADWPVLRSFLGSA